MSSKRDPQNILALIYSQLTKKKTPKLKTDKGQPSNVKKLIRRQGKKGS